MRERDGQKSHHAGTGVLGRQPHVLTPERPGPIPPGLGRLASLLQPVSMADELYTKIQYTGYVNKDYREVIAINIGRDVTGHLYGFGQDCSIYGASY